jgi:hypothetical protein
MVEFVFADLAAQRIAMDSQHFRGPALVSIGALQRALDEPLLEFSDRFIEKNSAFHHLTHKPFQLVLHDCTLRIRCEFVLRAGLPVQLAAG